MRPEGCQRYTPTPFYVFSKPNGEVKRWSFRLEDSLKAENRLVIVEVDDPNFRSRVYKSPHVEKFLPGKYLTQYIGECCCQQNFIAEVTPGEPIIEGFYEDKEVGPLSFAFSHEVFNMEFKVPKEQVWINTQLSQGNTVLGYSVC